MTSNLLILVLVFALLATSCTTRSVNSNSANVQPTPSATGKVVQITDRNYEEVIRSQKVVLLFFWAEWSAPDRFMVPVVEAIANEYADRVKIGKINVDDNPELTKKFNIKGIPALIVMKDGTERERKLGVASKKMVRDLLDKQLSSGPAAN